MKRTIILCTALICLTIHFAVKRICATIEARIAADYGVATMKLKVK